MYLSPLDILIFSLFLVLNIGSHVNDSEHRLIEDLLKDYKKDSRPVFNKSEAVKVELDVAYSQLVDLVRGGPFFFPWHAQKWHVKRATRRHSLKNMHEVSNNYGRKYGTFR